MKLFKKVDKPKINCLFLPGVPGVEKDFRLFADIQEIGGNIYWINYPGINNEKGKFTIEDSRKQIESSLKELAKYNLPIIIVAYSFSTFLIQQIDLKRYKEVIALLMFSPIHGLNKNFIDEDFLETIKALASNESLKTNIDYWQRNIDKFYLKDVEEVFEKLSNFPFPVVYAYSLNDSIIKVEELDKALHSFREKTRFNSFLVYRAHTGYHKLDSYYDKKIGNFIMGLGIAVDLEKILGKDIFIYYWGSSANYRYSNFDSDIDLLVFKDNHLKYYQELNEYVEKYNKSHLVKFDLSINDKNDLLSTKIFRYNRGPVAIHELKYAYFSIKKATNLKDLPWDILLKDAYSASQIMLGESKKILCKCDLKNVRTRKIIKYCITAFNYLLYFKGYKNIDLNNLEIYIDEKDKFTKQVLRCLNLKSNDYDGLAMDDLYQAVKAHELILKEQEKFLINQ